MMKAVKLGSTAPDFNALNQNQERFFLAKNATKGKILLVFYPADDTPVCSTQLANYRDHIEEFQKRGIQVYGISISSNESQKEFHEKLKLNFPLLADYDSRITTKYGVMSFTGHPKRASFLIDENQKIIYEKIEKLAIHYQDAQNLLKEIDRSLSEPNHETHPA